MTPIIDVNKPLRCVPAGGQTNPPFNVTFVGRDGPNIFFKRAPGSFWAADEHGQIVGHPAWRLENIIPKVKHTHWIVWYRGRIDGVYSLTFANPDTRAVFERDLGDQYISTSEITIEV